jgi:hypothetical protein
MKSILFLLFVLVFCQPATSPAYGQPPVGGAGAAAGTVPALPRMLDIVIVGGEVTSNNLRQRTTVVVFQVQQENRRPVAWAAIVVKPFALRGPAGWFLKGKPLTGITDANGLIKTAPLRLNHLARVQVLASFNGQQASLLVSQAQLLGGVTQAVGVGVGASAATATAGGLVTAGVAVSVPAVLAGAAAAGAAGVAGATATGVIGGKVAGPPSPAITIGLLGAPVFGPASLPAAPAGLGPHIAFPRAATPSGFVFSPSRGFTRWSAGQQLGARSAGSGWLAAGRLLRVPAIRAFMGPHVGLKLAVHHSSWDRLAAGRFLQTPRARVSIGPRHSAAGRRAR